MDKCIKGRCEPCHIVQVLEVIAAIKGEDIDTLADTIYQNTIDVFFPDESDSKRCDDKRPAKLDSSKTTNECNDVLDKIARNEANEWKCWLIRQQEPDVLLI